MFGMGCRCWRLHSILSPRRGFHNMNFINTLIGKLVYQMESTPNVVLYSLISPKKDTFRIPA